MRRLVRLAVAALLVVLPVSGCGAADRPVGQPTAIPGTGSAPAVMTVWQLRYLLLRRYPSFAYCDPDQYPVARGDQQAAADRWWSSTDHAAPEASAILRHLGYHEPLAGDQRLAAYRDHKRLTVIAMTATAGGYRYQLSTSSTRGGQPDQSVTGTITLGGTIRETGRQAHRVGCPICLAAGTRIATPHGAVPIALIRPGDQVWTTDPAGDRVPVPVRRVVRRPTPGPHLMLQLVLSDGRRLLAAGAHPAPDGTYLRQLRPGQGYDGAKVVSASWVVSTAPATFDILPAGSTATYWAGGILIGSTLTR